MSDKNSLLGELKKSRVHQRTILRQVGRLSLQKPIVFRPLLTEGLASSRTKAESLQKAYKPLGGLNGHPKVIDLKMGGLTW